MEDEARESIRKVTKGTLNHKTNYKAFIQIQFLKEKLLKQPAQGVQALTSTWHDPFPPHPPPTAINMQGSILILISTQQTSTNKPR